MVDKLLCINCPCLGKKQEGASKEDIEQLSKFKFRRIESNEKLTGTIQGPVGGIMTECQADSPIEHVLAEEDAVCHKFLLCMDEPFAPFSVGFVAPSLSRYCFTIFHVSNRDFVAYCFLV